MSLKLRLVGVVVVFLRARFGWYRFKMHTES